MSYEHFWLYFWGIVAGVIVFCSAAHLGHQRDIDRTVLALVKAGATPIEARCAIAPVEMICGKLREK